MNTELLEALELLEKEKDISKETMLEAIENSLSEVRDTRMKFKALAENQEKKTPVNVDDDQA